MATGEVKEIHNNGPTAVFEWRIPDFSQLRQVYNWSPTVTYFNMKWWIKITKTGDGIEFVWLVKELLAAKVNETVHFSIKCKVSGGEERDLAREQTLPVENRTWRLDISPLWIIPSSARVTFTCSLWKVNSPHAPGVSRETQTEDDIRTDEHPLEDISTLSENLKTLLHSGDDHDVLIKVKEKEFRAHKNILKARSPVFAAMFKSNMTESAEDSIVIEDCDPDAFGEFLQFLYSGKANIASVSTALGLYYAGDKYDFPRLKEICIQFLKNSFTTTTVFRVISLAARHGEEELLQQAIVYFADNLEETMLTVEWQRFLTANPIQANEMNLKALRCRLESSSCKKKMKFGLHV